MTINRYEIPVRQNGAVQHLSYQFLLSYKCEAHGFQTVKDLQLTNPHGCLWPTDWLPAWQIECDTASMPYRYI